MNGTACDMMDKDEVVKMEQAVFFARK